MYQVECSIPLEVHLKGRLTPGRLSDLGAAVEEAVASRLAGAEEAVAARKEERRRRRRAPRPAPASPAREPYDPEREERTAESYDLPSYELGGTRTTVPVRRAGARRLPPVRSFAAEWQEFVGHVDAGRTPQALAVATRLAGSISGDDAVQHAGELALWLLDQGESELAQLALLALEAAWWTRHVVEGGASVPSAVGASLLGGFGGLRSFGSPAGARTPRALLDRAEQEATAGRTEQAFALFRLAFLLIQTQLARYYEERTRRLDELDALQAQGVSLGVAALMSRSVSYRDLSYLYGMLREILGFYPRLEREALARGDVDQANVFSSLGFVLRETLEDRYLLETELTLTMESERATTPRGGPGYRIFGVGGREEVVEQLPGTPPPSELGACPSCHSTLENVVGSVAGQEQFVTDLYRTPEIVREFGSTPPDMGNRDDRLRVWSVMYRVFQRGSAGFGSALGSLLDLMERYLQAFTRHTVYNVRDFGVSYLTSEFPQDLVGRTVRDCGVYALTVAYELFLTVRRATPRLPVSFRLYSLPEHASLAIFDLDQDTHYVLNNDRIDGPFSGGPGGAEVLGNLARIYGVVFERPAVVAPTVPLELGTTAQSEASFRTRAWQRYLVSTQWGLRTPRGTTAPEVYERYYEEVARFGREMRALQANINRLRRDVAGAGAAARLLRERLPDLVTSGSALMTIFERYGPEAGPQRVLATRHPRLANLHPQYLFFFDDPAGRLDPLTRLGRALLLLRSLGGRGTDPATGASTLSADEEHLLLRFAAIPFMQANLQAFRPGPDF